MNTTPRSPFRSPSLQTQRSGVPLAGVLGVILLVALSTAPLAAQTRMSRGLFAGAPVMVSLEEVSGSGFDADQLFLKRPGFHDKAPREWSAAGVPAGRPSFDIQALLKQCGAKQPLDVDATSMGEDWVIADPCTGKTNLPANRWASVQFSVTEKSVGRAGTAIHNESQSAGGARSDIFSYVLNGSDMPKELVDVTHRALDSREIDLGTDTARRNINALDQFIPMYTLEPGIANEAPAGMMPQGLQFFFSLSKACVSKAPASWFGRAGPSGATILQVRWGTAGWTCPSPFLTYAEIGLNQDEDIDAIAIDLLNQHMLFSTDIRLRARNPILFFSWKIGCDSGAIQTYVDGGTNNPVSEEIGLILSDDVDAICAMDPSIRSRGNRRNPVYFAIGSPRAPLNLFPPRYLNASSFRDYDGVDIMLKTYVSGWPQDRPPAAGLAGLFLTPNGAVNPFLILKVLKRDPANPVAGDPREATLVIPPAFSLLDNPLNLRWFAVETAKSVFAEAFPLLIRQ